jgi:trehalose-phosphatase
VSSTPGPTAAGRAEDAFEAVALIAGREPLLVALDFDGVCAPLVDDPATSRMLGPTREAVRQLHADGCHVALVSGRALADLRAVAEPEPGWLLVGGHGAEPGHGDGPALSEQESRLLRDIGAAVDDVVAQHPGTAAEHKPTSVVLHTRRADDERTAAATEAVLAGPAARDGVHTRRGHDVVEMAVVVADKGTAVRGLRERTGAASVLYVGDDVTDEDAFAALDPEAGDVGVKVGDGDTVAAHRVASPEAVTDLLVRLQRARAQARARA